MHITMEIGHAESLGGEASGMRGFDEDTTQAGTGGQEERAVDEAVKVSVQVGEPGVEEGDNLEKNESQEREGNRVENRDRVQERETPPNALQGEKTERDFANSEQDVVRLEQREAEEEVDHPARSKNEREGEKEEQVETMQENVQGSEIDQGQPNQNENPNRKERTEEGRRLVSEKDRLRTVEDLMREAWEGVNKERRIQEEDRLRQKEIIENIAESVRREEEHIRKIKALMDIHMMMEK